jgi:CheY-like chemotaxis protein
MKETRILPVENNALKAKMVHPLLNHDSYRGSEAGKDPRGPLLARGAKSDLILVNFQLPGMQGLSAVRMRQKNSLLQTPSAALTSHWRKERYFMENGCEDEQ